MALATLILPTLDEAGLIDAQLREIREVMPGSVLRIIVVDESSADGTANAARASGLPGVEVHSVVRGTRLAGSIQHGLDRADTPWVGWMDADCSVEAASLEGLMERVERDAADIVVGSRYVPGARAGGDSPLARASSRLLSRLATLTALPGIRDPTSGCLMMRRSVAQRLRLRGRHGEYQIVLLAEALRDGLEVVEVPIRTRPRTLGRSKTNPSLRTFTFHLARYAGALARAIWIGCRSSWFTT